MVAEVADLAEVPSLVPDGCGLGVGGILLQRKPMALLDVLARAGRRDLALHSFLASLDAELLAAHGCLAEAHVGYVGFEQLGRAVAFEAAAAAGRIRVHEYTEYLFVAGLRAALAGLPFLPTKGGTGSDVTAELGLATVTCPYTGTELVAVPSLRLDVALVHAPAADTRGNVLGPSERTFLFDFDANLARAADRVVVSVDEIVPTSLVRAHSSRTLLYGHEVDVVVLAPRGAVPTGSSATDPPDLGALRAYLDDVGAGADPAQAMSRLMATVAGA